MSKLRIELLVIRATVELEPEVSAPAVVETQGLTLSERPGLAKTRPANVLPFVRRVAR